MLPVGFRNALVQGDPVTLAAVAIVLTEQKVSTSRFPEVLLHAEERLGYARWVFSDGAGHLKKTLARAFPFAWHGTDLNHVLRNCHKKVKDECGSADEEVWQGIRKDLLGYEQIGRKGVIQAKSEEEAERPVWERMAVWPKGFYEYFERNKVFVNELSVWARSQAGSISAAGTVDNVYTQDIESLHKALSRAAGEREVSMVDMGASCKEYSLDQLSQMDRGLLLKTSFTAQSARTCGRPGAEPAGNGKRLGGKDFRGASKARQTHVKCYRAATWATLAHNTSLGQRG